MSATGDNYFREKLAENDVWLAPLAGVSDAPMRRICSESGALLMTSEMVSAKGLVYKNANCAPLMILNENETDTGLQIFGSDLGALREAVLAHVNGTDFAFIDINMGCPVKKVVRGGDGCALMGDLDKLYQVAKTVAEASLKPVSAKIRLGLTNQSINCAEAAKRLEAAGVGCIAVHGRTQEQLYGAAADWEQIARVAEAVKIPVVGNGDVTSPETYASMKRRTGCAGVMIGRAAMSDPFIFRQIKEYKETGRYRRTDPLEKTELMRRHFSYLLRYAGQITLRGSEAAQQFACRQFRAHIGRYTKGMNGGAQARRQACCVLSAADIYHILDELEQRQ